MANIQEVTAKASESFQSLYSLLIAEVNQRQTTQLMEMNKRLEGLQQKINSLDQDNITLQNNLTNYEAQVIKNIDTKLLSVTAMLDKKDQTRDQHLSEKEMEREKKITATKFMIEQKFKALGKIYLDQV